MRLAIKLVNAARNQYNWDFYSNGEVWTVEWAVTNHAGAVFDVGSNEGQWATAALPYCQGRSMHCFEPVPATFTHLQRNLAREPTVVLNNLGLASETGTISFNYCPSTSDVSSRYDIPDVFAKPTDQVIEVQTVTGDEYCEDRDIETIALLKIDVEGMEHEVLCGFRSMLAEGRIKVIQFEYGTGYVGARRYLRDVVEMLDEAGYALFEQYPHDLEPFRYSEESEDFRVRNLVAALDPDKRRAVRHV